MSLDRNTLLRLLMTERGIITGFIYSICADPEMTEDVYQDLAVLVTEKSPQIEDRRHFLSWIRTCARYKVNNLARKQRRQLALDDRVLDLLEAHWDESASDSGVNLSEKLESCVARLTPAKRKLLHLRFTEGLTGQQLADALDRKLNTVHVALSRCYRFLMVCIERCTVSEKHHE